MRDVLIGLLAAVPGCAAVAQVIVERQRSELRDTYGPRLAEVVEPRQVRLLVVVAAMGPVIVDVLALVPNSRFPVPEATVELIAVLVSLVGIVALLGIGVAAATRTGVFDSGEEAVYERAARILRAPDTGKQRRASVALLESALHRNQATWEQAFDETRALLQHDHAALPSVLEWLDRQAGSATSPEELGRLLEIASVVGESAAAAGSDTIRKSSVELTSLLLDRAATGDPHFSRAASAAFDALAALIAATPDDGGAAKLVGYLRSNRFSAGREPSDTFQRLELQFGCLVLTEAAEGRRKTLALAAIDLSEQLLLRGRLTRLTAIYLAALRSLREDPWAATELRPRVRVTLERLRRKATARGDELLEGNIGLLQDAWLGRGSKD